MFTKVRRQKLIYELVKTNSVIKGKRNPTEKVK